MASNNNNVYVVYDDGAGNYYIKSYDSDGVLLDTWSIEATENIGNALCVDIDGNVYTVTSDQHSIKKRDSSGTVTLTKTETNYIYGIAVGPDGYIYTLESDSGQNSDYISKRNASDLVSVDTLVLDATGWDTYYGLTIDSDGYFYTVNASDKKYEIWDWTSGLMSSSSGEYTFASLATVGDNIANVDWLAHTILIPKDWSGGETDYNLANLDTPAALGYTYGDYYLVSGYHSGNVTIGKYDGSFSEVWVVKVVDNGNYGSIGSYPFAAPVYDYPLAPIMFPAQHKGTSLREKCINFEESMSDVCLNMNNNVKVIREYLQLTYGDTTYPESSNLRDVLPSQQLVKLSNKDLKTEDFNAIINNFITNISSMFTLINENNTLVKTWLDDYEPNEEGHDFTDVKMKPIIIDKDIDEDKLSKIMDSLFEAIEDNVTILNMNLEVLKERF